MAARRWLLGWVLVALLGAQALGLMHRVVHGAPASGPHETAWIAPAEVAAEVQAAGWLASLFNGHDEPGCRLFDAVGHDDLSPPDGPSAPALPPADARRAPVATGSAGCEPPPFQARGPPVSR